MVPQKLHLRTPPDSVKHSATVSPPVKNPSRFGLTGELPTVWTYAVSADRNGRAKAGTATKADESASDQAMSPTGVQR